MTRMIALFGALVAPVAWAHPGHAALEANHVHVWDLYGWLLVAVVLFAGVRLVNKRLRRAS